MSHVAVCGPTQNRPDSGLATSVENNIDYFKELQYLLIRHADFGSVYIPRIVCNESGIGGIILN
jgi:hypothetical protein